MSKLPIPIHVALQSKGYVTQAGGATAVPVGLEGYHRLDSMTKIDQQVLSTCRTNRSRGLVL